MDMISSETMSGYMGEYETCSAFVEDNLQFPDVREETGRQ
jgi:hypothetical protein